MEQKRLPRPLLVALALVTLASGAPVALAATRSHSSPRVHRRHAPITRPRRARISQAAGAADPSGIPMPTAPIRGWREVFADDFTGSTLNTDLWRTYWGQPGGDPGGWFDPSHVSVSNGELVLSGYQDPADGGKWATAGVSSSPGLVQTYGKYLVRFRFDAGVGIAHAILLWPADNSWPPEIDFSEDNGANRQTDYATLHFGSSNTQVQRSVGCEPHAVAHARGRVDGGATRVHARRAQLGHRHGCAGPRRFRWPWTSRRRPGPAARRPGSSAPTRPRPRM